MQRLNRAAVCCVLVSSLAACVVTPPPQPPAAPRRASTPPPARPKLSNPPAAASDRIQQITGRIDTLHRRIDVRVAGGAYAAPQSAALHHRLDVIRREAGDMAAQHGGGLSVDEQRVLNHELDTVAHAIDA